jgi:phosphoglycerol transferase MdoB-like AlkP superfamily enzyme
MGDADYTSTFIYGGEAHFDNMSGFFLGNGFNRVIDQNDYKEYRFTGSWGVSDEDLFDKLDETLLVSRAPNFVVAFTSSFHSPYEFPDDQIDLVEEAKASKRNAVKYADHALGEFLDRARASVYWQGSIFLIAADHDECPRGKDLVPIKGYHIPGLILRDGVDAMDVDKIARQIELLPTLLRLAGISATVPLLGQDVLSGGR